MTPLLSVSDLRAYYGGTQALYGLDLELSQGSITALLGANGAGKTTALRAISGMVRTSGAVMFDGKPIAGKPTERIAQAGIAHVPQGRGTFAGMTVAENLHLGAIARTDRRTVRDDVDRVYGYFPVLRQRRNQLAGTLSGGEQQMLAVARALMLRPRLLLLDEPSFGLAPLIVIELFEILKTINRTEGVTILVVEQNAKLALEIAEFTSVIEAGCICANGTAADIAGMDSIRRSYLGQ